MPRPTKHISRWTEAERRWFEHYQRHGNASQAVREAGYDVDPHDYGLHASMGHEIANRPHIKAAIEAYGEELSRRYALTPDNILAELILIAKANIADYLVIEEGKAPVVDLSKAKRHELASLLAVTIKDGETKVQLQPKIQALELLGKHLKLFTDRLEIEGSVDPARELQAARRRANLLIEQEKRDGSGEGD